MKKKSDNTLKLIYKKHFKDEGLISTYDKNINEAVKKRDQIASKSVDYMIKKVKEKKI